jgi:hypothetical protein
MVIARQQSAWFDGAGRCGEEGKTTKMKRF